MINCEQLNGRLTISYIDDKGEIALEKIGIPKSALFEWVPKNPVATQRIYHVSELTKQKTRYLNKFRLMEFLHSLDQPTQDKIFSNNVPKMYFCDIETEVLDEFPTAENPKAQILTISIVNEKEQCVILGLKELSDTGLSKLKEKINNHFKPFNKKISVKYQKYEDETDMLYSFFKQYVPKMSLITGWNFVEFDWMYLVARSKKLGIKPEICSLTGKLSERDGHMPLHRIVVDYMRVYKKWDTTILPKESNSLDWVSETLLKIKKIKYKGTLNDLYARDFEEFIFYNAVDAFLVRMIHQELKTLNAYIGLAAVTHVENIKSYSPVYMTESLLCQELKKKDKYIVPSKDKSKDSDQKDYEGAFVVKPIPGLYEYVATFDFASLYPSIQRQFNISPDTYVGKNIKIPDEEKENYIKTVNGCYFKKNEDGAMRLILTRLFAKRKEAKKHALKIEQEIDYLKKILKQK